jgi:hypothetical protein
MSLFKTYRDPELSLWQSAVEEAFAAPAGTVAGLTPAVARFLHAAESVADLVHLTRAVRGEDPVADALPTKPVLEAADLPPPLDLQNDMSRFGLLVMALARRLEGQANLFRRLIQTRFSILDSRWVQAALNYFDYYKLHRGDIPYRRYKSPDEFIIDGKLPEQARVALVADWGTGRPEAMEVLDRIAEKRPDVLIHLGDVYYAGTEPQFRRFREVWDTTFPPANANPVKLTMSGNHDMYSGGQPYYDTIDHFGQPASYFCLRNAYWQILAVDTGLLNHEIKFPSGDPHGLDHAEAQWLQHQVANAAGCGTILLSHHQPYSAFERLSGQGPVNVELLESARPILNRVSAWFWGHEHDLVIYEQYEGILGRCIGCGAVPVSLLEHRADRAAPYGDFAVPPVAPCELSLDAGGSFYNHGYAILTLQGPNAQVTYYEVSRPERILFEEKMERRL